MLLPEAYSLKFPQVLHDAPRRPSRHGHSDVTGSWPTLSLSSGEAEEEAL